MNVQEIIAYLYAERTRLDRAITALGGVTPRRGRAPNDSRGSGRRVMNAAARKRISAAMKARDMPGVLSTTWTLTLASISPA